MRPKSVDPVTGAFYLFLTWFIKRFGASGHYDFFPSFMHGDGLNIILCNIILDIFEIKRMAALFITMGFVNNYEENCYHKKFL